MTALIIFGVWNALAFNIIVILAGLRSIDKNYYKVAEMFGASSWEQFRKITLPQLKSIITFLFLTSLSQPLRSTIQSLPSLMAGQVSAIDL